MGQWAWLQLQRGPGFAAVTGARVSCYLQFTPPAAAVCCVRVSRDCWRRQAAPTDLHVSAMATMRTMTALRTTVTTVRGVERVADLYDWCALISWCGTGHLAVGGAVVCGNARATQVPSSQTRFNTTTTKTAWAMYVQGMARALQCVVGSWGFLEFKRRVTVDMPAIARPTCPRSGVRQLPNGVQSPSNRHGW